MSETGDATALIKNIYYAARSFIEHDVAHRPGDGQVTTDYIIQVGDDLFVEENGSGETVLTFVFKDFGSMCPLGSRACRHWFELAFTQIDLEDQARSAGFTLAEKVPGLAEVLVTPSPLTYIGNLVACEKKADGSFNLIADQGGHVPDWSPLPKKKRDEIASLFEKRGVTARCAGRSSSHGGQPRCSSFAR